jgi:hypothetical protein
MKHKQMLIAVVLLAFAAMFVATPAAPARVAVGIAVGAPPPAPLAVAPVGVAPGPGYIWIDGYWDWVNGGWVWVPGRWVLPPAHRAVWIGPVYRRDHDRYRYFRGHWDRR